MPITVSPGAETVKPKPSRKRTPAGTGTARKKAPRGKKVAVDGLGDSGADDEPEAWYRRASLADVLDELSRCGVPLSLRWIGRLLIGVE